MTGPLEGISVLELAVALAAPSATAMLGDWGASVIKVEPLTGDPQRGNSSNAYFSQDNRQKRSVAVVLRTDQRREIEFTAADPSLLDAAARAGIDVPFSCKSGVCSTCRARLLEGEVRMDRNFALEPHEVDAGFILTCQAHPLTERVVVSYDDR